MSTHYCHVQTRFGRVLLTSDGRALSGLYFEGQKHAPAVAPDWCEGAGTAPFPAVAKQLAEYDAGRRDRFELPLALAGTVFQRRVWQALLEVPCGTTISYAELARRVGAPRGVRAVGAAVGRNPVSVIVPCHRVVGSDGSLTGYAGGLERKRALLARERAPVVAEAALP